MCVVGCQEEGRAALEIYDSLFETVASDVCVCVCVPAMISQHIRESHAHKIHNKVVTRSINSSGSSNTDPVEAVTTNDPGVTPEPPRDHRRRVHQVCFCHFRRSFQLVFLKRKKKKKNSAVHENVCGKSKMRKFSCLLLARKLLCESNPSIDCWVKLCSKSKDTI